MDFSNIDFPVGLSDILRFEKLNPDISIRIFRHCDGNFFPIHQTKFEESDHSVRIPVNIVQNTTICWNTGEMSDHFYPIINLSKFTQKLYKSKNPGGRTTYSKTTSCSVCTETFCFKRESFASAVMSDGDIHLGHNTKDLTEKFISHQFNCLRG